MKKNTSGAKSPREQGLWRLLLPAAVLLLFALVFAAPAAADLCADSHSGWTSLEASTDKIETDGNYYLANDVKLSSTLQINANVTLCLNGNVLNVTSGNVIKVNSGKTLNITDHNAEKTHSFTVGEDGLWTLDEDADDGEEVTGGVITGGSSASGGGIYVDGGTLNLIAGNIVGNKASNGDGGAVRVVGGSACFKLYDGATIKGNLATSGGGGVQVTSPSAGTAGKFYMYGGEISSNTANDKGGGVRLGGSHDPELYMYGGKITGNIAKNEGGGVSVASGGTFTMEGGTITENKVTGNGNQGFGGGVYTQGTFTMNANGDTSGLISENEAYHGGAGVYVRGGSFTMENGEISGNTVTGTGSDNHGGGGVSISTAAVTLNGGTITGNKASKGSGILAWEGSLTVSGSPVVTGNTNLAGENHNVYLNTDKTITIGGGLETGADIGVTTAAAVPVAITDAYASADYSAYFKADDGNSVSVYNTEDKKIYLTNVLNVENGEVTISSETGGSDEVITLTAEPEDGYMLKEFIVTKKGTDPAERVDVSIDPTNLNKGTFTMPTEGVTIDAVFAPIPVTLTHTALKDGNVLKVNETGMLDDIVFVADDGYIFNEDDYNQRTDGLTYTISEDGKELTVSGALDVDTPVEIIAEGKTHTDVAAEAEHGTVTISPATPKTGELVTITATPDAGYKFEGFTVIDKTTGESIAVTVNGNTGTFIMPPGGAIITATFTKISLDSGSSTGSSVWLTGSQTPGTTTPGTQTGSATASVGADGTASFGTTYIIYSVTMIEGYNGDVTLTPTSDVQPPAGKDTYHVADISVSTPMSIGKTAIIHFAVPLSALQAKGLGAEDVRLYHHDGAAWNGLPTVYTITGDIVYYEAVTDSFSPFAIVFEENGATEKGAAQPTDAADSPLSVLAVLGGLGAVAVLRRK